MCYQKWNWEEGVKENKNENSHCYPHIRAQWSSLGECTCEKWLDKYECYWAAHWWTCYLICSSNLESCALKQSFILKEIPENVFHSKTSNNPLMNALQEVATFWYKAFPEGTYARVLKRRLVLTEGRVGYRLRFSQLNFQKTPKQ